MRFIHTCAWAVFVVIALAISYAAALFLLAILLLSTPAQAHDAPAGWSYPYSCCTNHDCRMVPAAAIGEGPAGFTIRATGETVPYADRRVRQSPDGLFHWCSIAGRDDTRTLCLFVPPRGM